MCPFKSCRKSCTTSSMRYNLKSYDPNVITAHSTVLNVNFNSKPYIYESCDVAYIACEQWNYEEAWKDEVRRKL